MPLIANSTYTPPPLFRNGHLQTLYPVLFRRVPGIAYTRERISTPDDDFLDLDWARIGADSLVIVLHGLEGSSRRLHVRGMVLALNRRGCSGVPNRRARASNLTYMHLVTRMLGLGLVLLPPDFDVVLTLACYTGAYLPSYEPKE